MFYIDYLSLFKPNTRDLKTHKTIKNRELINVKDENSLNILYYLNL